MYCITTKKGGETTFDGDGRAVKRSDLTKSYISGQWEAEWNRTNSYCIYSSVTDQKITDVAQDGTFSLMHVYMGGSIIAEQSDADPEFKVNDPVTGSMWKTTNVRSTLPGNREVLP